MELLINETKYVKFLEELQTEARQTKGTIKT